MSTENRMTGPKRIYVACLASYNAGKSHGAWLVVSNDVDELKAGIRLMLDLSQETGAEEYAIQDVEGFGAVPIGEYDSLERIVEIAGFLRGQGDLAATVLDYFK